MTEQLLEGFKAMSGWEYVGVFFGLLYLILAMRQSLWCWPAAFISTLVYTILFWQGALLMESALNVYYLLMAIYGYWQWRGQNKDLSQHESQHESQHKNQNLSQENDQQHESLDLNDAQTNERIDTSTKPIVSWSLQKHGMIIGITSLVSVLAGYLLQEYSHAQMAYLDSFTTCFAVVTTYLVTQKVLENWLYWVVIDLASIYLYLEMGYLPTAALFVVYTVLAVQGYRVWRKESDNEFVNVAQGSI